MKLGTLVMLIIILIICFMFMCWGGVAAVSKTLPSTDEASVYPTYAPLELKNAGPLFLPEPTGPPLYLYSEAKSTREDP